LIRKPVSLDLATGSFTATPRNDTVLRSDRIARPLFSHDRVRRAKLAPAVSHRAYAAKRISLARSEGLLGFEGRGDTSMENGKKESTSNDTPHRRGVLRGVAAGAASGLGLHGGVAEAKAPAERGSPAYGSVVYIEDFAPDYFGPDYDWTSAIYRAMESFPGNEKRLPGGTIVFANRYNLEEYKVHSTIVVRRQLHFMGAAGYLVNGYGGLSPTLRFPPNVDGFHFFTAEKGPDSVGSKLSNLRIFGSGGLSSKGRGAAIRANACLDLYNCAIKFWYDYCVHYFTDERNVGPDGWRITNCDIGVCWGTGFHVTGHNAQVGTMISSFVTRCESGRAIHDDSFLGNTYIGVMCSRGGIVTSGDQENGGNTCTFIGCYVEGGNPCNIAYPSIVIGGELSSMGNSDTPLGSAFFCDGTNISNGLKYWASEWTGAYFDGKHTVENPPKRRRTAHITFGGSGGPRGAARDPHTLMSFGEEQDKTYWTFAWWRPGQISWSYAGASVDYHCLNYYTKAATPANGFSRDLSNEGLGGIGFSLGFFLGGRHQKITSDVAAPHHGSHAAGDICFNPDFKPLGVSHWRCVASGTPGTWEPVFEVSGKPYAVAALPKPGPQLQGARAVVTDAREPSFLAPLVGGGSTVCPAFCNGAAWVAG
jgi:hypothetical protein